MYIYIQSKKQALARVLLFSERYLGIQLPRAGSEESRMRRFNVNTSEKAVVTSLIVITRSHVWPMKLQSMGMAKIVGG